MRSSRVRTLIAIPVFNEVRHVDHVLDRVLSRHPDVLLVDDGSTDGTADKLAGRKDVRLIRHARNAGYGRSLIDAFAYAAKERFDWVLTMDCDEQHEPEKIPAFLDMIAQDRWDLISGTRYAARNAHDDAAPHDRAAINASLTRLINAIYPLRLTDSFCGFKAHRVPAMKRVTLTETGYAFPMQLWPQVVAADLRVTELSVRRIYNDPNRSFGATLDQPLVRLTHYLDVLAIEHQKLFGEAVDWPTAQELLSGSAVMPVRRVPPAVVPPVRAAKPAGPLTACCGGCGCG